MAGLQVTSPSAGSISPALPRSPAWCRAIVPIVAVIYLERPGREQAISELLTLAR
jgi:hypothetical protein